MNSHVDKNKILTNKQKQAIRESNARINILHGAMRSGKTVGALWRWIKFIGNSPDGDLIMIGKSIGSLYRNMIRPLQEMLGNQMFYSSGKHEVDIWEKKIFCFGAFDESSEGILRGLTAAGALGDECTLWPKSFFYTMLSRLSVKGAKFFGTTNTDSPYHYLKKDFLDRKGLDLYQLQFQLEDNADNLPPEYADNLKKEFTGLWYKRFIEGLWVAAEGAIYDFWDEMLYCLLKPPRRAETMSVAVDYGTGNPTVFLLFGEDPNAKLKCWCEREYYYDSVTMARQKTDDEYADDFIKWMSLDVSLIRDVYIDPSALSFIVALKKKLASRGIFLNFPVVDNNVIDGIRFTASMLQRKEVMVCHCCVHVKTEFSAYAWDKKKQLLGIDEPLKQNDHCMDPFRYYIWNKYGIDRQIIDLSSIPQAESFSRG
jgi:PBSX family phage terminase large subunit